MLGQAGGEHVGQKAGHDRGTKHVVQAVEAFSEEEFVHVVEEVVHILHRHQKVLGSQIETAGPVTD